MPIDLEINRAANPHTQQHRYDAPVECARLADATLVKGDLEGQRVWKRVLAAIDVLRAEERPDRVPLQSGKTPCLPRGWLVGSAHGQKMGNRFGPEPGWAG